ncbi:MAG: HAMP domain-containing sensor histidine kinase [Gemmatimonadota bacterium]|nr:HAMP domain-containing sensor histidine kinase [Gemmatimonadota bacterium]
MALRDALRAWAERALRLRLFYKILVANGVVVALGVVAGALLHPEMAWIEPEASLVGVIVPLGIAAVAASVLVNGFILRFALEPVRRLEETAERVRRGNLSARVPPSRFADPDLERIADAFNDVLDSVEAYRRRLRDGAARSVRAEEEERRRVASELHDDTAQRLASLLVQMRMVEDRNDTERARTLLSEARDEVAGALEVVRRYALGRRPLALDDLGLSSAIESYARDVFRGTDVKVEMEADERRPSLSPDVELALFRIVQEALDNVARHAGAGVVGIRVRRDDGRARVTVEDDGRGFPLEETRERECLGLFEMEERAVAVGANVEIASAPGEGTRVEIVAPVETSED